jgi:hypothetical protein
MITVQPISRTAIDQWLISDSGLPARVVNSANSAGIRTIGELRNWSDVDLLALKSLGKISLGHIHFFFRICRQIEEGRQRFQNIQEVLDIFLDTAERTVLSARYGLHLPLLKASRNCVTLQEIGTAHQKTRERIRQVEETAKARLRSRLAAVCLRPFYEYFTAFIEQHHRAVSVENLAPLKTDGLLVGLNPAGVLLLLFDLDNRFFCFHRGFFSSLPASALEQLERWLLQHLDKQTEPLALAAIPVDQVDLGLSDFREDKPVISGVLLDHCPEVAATTAQHYFLFSRGIQSFLLELIKTLNRPVHYREVTRVFNERVKPGSRKGAGFILDALNNHPACIRTDRGIYDLR